MHEITDVVNADREGIQGFCLGIPMLRGTGDKEEPAKTSKKEQSVIYVERQQRAWCPGSQQENIY